MKKTIIISSAVLASLFSAAASYASNETQELAPTKVVAPIAREHEVGKTVSVVVTISQEGLPTQVKAVDVDPYDQLLAARVVKAVSQWEFETAQDSYGNPVAKTVVLPIVIENIKS